MAKGIFSFLIVDLPAVAGGLADDQNSESFWMVTANPGRNRMSAGKQGIPHEENEINRWARLAKDGTPEEREEAWRKLDSAIRKLVYDIAAKYALSPQELSELADEAPTAVYTRFNSFDPVRGNFRAWCYQVLDRWLIDEHRKKGRRRRRERPISEVFDAESRPNEGMAECPIEDHHLSDPATQAQWRMDLDRDFGEEDLQELEKIPVKRRVFGLAVAGLWDRVPKETWQAWVDKIDGLPQPFPPPGIEDCQTPNDRIHFLADCLNVSSQSVRMHYERMENKIRSLRWFDSFRSP